MAFSTADFSKIWASTSPLTPYEFSEANYKEGWNFISSTPPARQMWDSVQKLNDEKSKWLYDNVETLNAKTQCGSVDNISVANGVVTTNAVTFDTPFDSAPIVTVTMTGMTSGGIENPSKLQIYTYNVTKNGFSTRIYNNGTATYTLAIHWIAIQP